MFFLKKFFISITVFILFLLLFFFTLINTHFGLQIFCGCAHYFIPGLKIESSIGTIKNCLLKNVTYKGVSITFTVKKISLSTTLCFSKQFHIIINKFLLDTLYIASHKNLLHHLDKSTQIFFYDKIKNINIPIFFKDIKIYNVTGKLWSLKIFLDHCFSYGYYYNNKLKLLTTQINSINIRDYRCNIDKQYELFKYNKEKHNDTFSKNILKQVINFLNSLDINYAINLDVKDLFDNKICIVTPHNIFNFKVNTSFILFKNKLFINSFSLFYSVYSFNIKGWLNFKNYSINLFITDINIKLYRYTENINVLLTGSLLTQLNISVYLTGLVNSNIKLLFRWNFSNATYKLVVKSNKINFLRGLCLEFSLENYKFLVFGDVYKYFFYSTSIINNQFIKSIQFDCSGKGNYQTIVVKSINFKILKNLLFSKKNSVSSKCSVSRLYNNTFRNSNINIFQSFSDNFLVFINYFKKCNKQSLFFVKIFNLLFSEKRIRIFGSIAKNSKEQYFVPQINFQVGTSYCNIQNSYVHNKIININFIINDLSEIIFNFKGKLTGNIKIIDDHNNKIHIISKFLGKNLNFKIFNKLNLNLYIDFKINQLNINSMHIVIKKMNILENDIDFFSLNINNYKYYCNIKLYISVKQWFIYLDYISQLKRYSKLWRSRINLFKIHTNRFNIYVKNINSLNSISNNTQFLDILNLNNNYVLKDYFLFFRNKILFFLNSSYCKRNIDLNLNSKIYNNKAYLINFFTICQIKDKNINFDWLFNIHHKLVLSYLFGSIEVKDVFNSSILSGFLKIIDFPISLVSQFNKLKFFSKNILFGDFKIYGSLNNFKFLSNFYCNNDLYTRNKFSKTLHIKTVILVVNFDKIYVKNYIRINGYFSAFFEYKWSIYFVKHSLFWNNDIEFLNITVKLMSLVNIIKMCYLLYNNVNINSYYTSYLVNTKESMSIPIIINILFNVNSKFFLNFLVVKISLYPLFQILNINKNYVLFLYPINKNIFLKICIKFS